MATNSTKMSKQDRYRVIRKATWIGVVTNIFLSVAQLTGGFFAHSQALLADGLHTLSDLASDFIVLLAAKIASKEADEDHPYGHGRFETLGTVILGLILSAVAIGIVINAINRLFFATPSVNQMPETIALVFAVLAVICKEGLYQYTVIKAKQINSDLLKANAWHHRSDAVSSIIVLVGIASAIFFQISWLDALAAIFVALMIFIMGFKLVINSVNELLESAVSPAKIQEITDLLSGLEYVENLHMLRTRSLGGQIFADVHIQVSSHLSVSEGHMIAECITKKLSQNFPEIEDVTVHIDPEDDETAQSCTSLAMRSELEPQINTLFKEHNLQDAFQKMLLHYLDGRIEIEIFLGHGSYDKLEMTTLLDKCCCIENVSRVFLHQQVASVSR